MIAPTGPAGPTGPAFECRCNYSEYYITQGTLSANTYLNTVDASTGNIADSFPLAAGPQIASNPQNGLLYLRQEADKVIAADPKTQAIVATIAPAIMPPVIHGFALDPALYRLYIFEQTGVLIYDTDTHEQVGFINVPGTVAFSTPNGLVDPATHNLALFFGGYPTGCGRVEIRTPDGSLVSYNPTFCGSQMDAAFSPDGQTLYSIASNLVSPDYNLHMLNTGNGQQSVTPLPTTNIKGIGVNSNNGLVYLVDPNNGIYVYNPSGQSTSGPYYAGSFGSSLSAFGVTFDPAKNQILIRTDSLLKIVDAGTMSLAGETTAVLSSGSFQRAAVLTHSDPCCGATGPTGPTGPAGECDCCRGCGAHPYLYSVSAVDYVTGAAGIIEKTDPETQDVLFSVETTNAKVIASDAARNRLFVGRGVEGLDFLNACTGALTAHFDEEASGMAVNPVTGKVYTSQFVYSPHGVAVYSQMPPALLSSIPTDQGGQVAIDYCANKVFVRSPSGLIAIDGATDTIVDTVTLSSGLESGIAIDSYRHLAYLPNNSPRVLDVVDTLTDTIVRTAPIPALISYYPISVAVNPITNKIYLGFQNALAPAASTIVVLNGATFATEATLTVDMMPTQMAMDTKSNLLYFGDNLYGNGTQGVLSGFTDTVLEYRALPYDVLAANTVDFCPDCGNAGVSFPDAFVVTGTSAGSVQSAYLAGFVPFGMTELNLKGNVTALDNTHFRVNTAGTYEIGMRVPVFNASTSPVSMSFGYSLQVNGTAVLRDYLYRSVAQPSISNQPIIANYNQVTKQLRVGDVLSVAITDYVSDSISTDFLEGQALTIRKTC